jgi:hypothetical protein
MSCPHLKEVVMLYCDAYAVKKMVPLDRLVSTEPCLSTEDWPRCPLFQDVPPPAPRAPAEAAAPTDVEATR